MGGTVEAYRVALAAYREAEARADAIRASLPADVLDPWVPGSARAGWDIGHRVRLHTVKQATDFFDEFIARFSTPEAARTAGLLSGRESYVQRLRRYRAEALAVLKARERVIEDAGLYAAWDRMDELNLPLEKAATALIDAPCHSLADVQAKAAALLADGEGDFSDLEYSQSKRVLASFLERIV
jgi:hypothetical protein